MVNEHSRINAVNAFALLLAAAFLLWPYESRADWEYTTYGMTADEIVAASAGKAWKLSGAEQQNMSTAFATAIAASTHETGPFNFAVIFFADKGGSQLGTVRLNLKSQDEFQTRAQVEELRNALTGKYGQPLGNQVEQSQFFTTTQWNWQGESDNILLKYLDGINSAWVEYTQLLKNLDL